jgi:hypothetical protein
MLGRATLTVVLACVVAPLAGRAQAPGVLLRGTVVDRQTGQPLEHAMVSLSPVGRQSFSSAQGQFGFAALPPGSYRLRVARLGFTPRDLAVTVAIGADPPAVRVELDRATFSLAAVRVLAYPPCARPGAPDPLTNPDFAGIFEQLRQNAEQYRVLSDSFPFGYRFERTRGDRRADSTRLIERVDTQLVRSDHDRWRYRPGNVVARDAGGYVMQLPTLADFASREFIRNHCFYYAGVDTTTDGRQVRVDFRAADRLRTPDVHGSVLLDATSYQIRRAELDLSIVPEALRDVVRAHVTTIFREVSPSIVVFEEVRGATVLRPSRSPGAFAESFEEQRLLEFGWLRADPGRVP